MTTTVECPFCTLAPGRAVLAEDQLSQVLLSDPRLMPGHLLVIPKRHIEALWELTAPELGSIFAHITAFEKRLLATFGTGCDIRQNYRPFLQDGPLKRSHLHFHIYPRTLEDTLYRQSQIHESALFTPLSDAERDEVVSKLMSAQ